MMAKSFEDATGLMPEIVADCVLREIGRDDREAATRLANKARATYAANKRFNEKLRGAGGREHLYSFMRHWLSADILRREGRKAYNELPYGFNVGREPPRSPA